MPVAARLRQWRSCARPARPDQRLDPPAFVRLDHREEKRDGRLARALGELPGGAREAAIAFFLAMIEPGERGRIEALVWPGGARA